MVLGIQSCAVAAGGSIAEDLSTSVSDKKEAEDLAGAGGAGIFAALLWLVAAAFVMSKPKVSMWLFGIASVLCLIGGSSGFSDLYIWAVASAIFAVMSWRGIKEKEKDEASASAKYQADIAAAAASLQQQTQPDPPAPPTK